MKLLKCINRFIDRIGHDIRLFNPKLSLIMGGVTLILGIISWMVGGRGEGVLMLYIFPRHAFPLGLMYFMWAISFFFVGVVIGGIAFGCEKYKRKDALKSVVFLAFSLLFTLFVYPIFFKSMAPFITFVAIFVSFLLCLIAIMASSRIYSLWTLCIGIHLLWLAYNGYISLCVAMIN